MLGFYDIWVARDTNGSLFLKKPPYVSERAALQRISQGLPFPVRCCWNGLVVLNAMPFLQHRMRLRCASSGPPGDISHQVPVLMGAVSMCLVSGHVLILTPRHRGHKRSECAASECSLLCNDFLQLGYGRMLVDPGVRQVRVVPVLSDVPSAIVLFIVH